MRLSILPLVAALSLLVPAGSPAAVACGSSGTTCASLQIQNIPTSVLDLNINGTVTQDGRGSLGGTIRGRLGESFAVLSAPEAVEATLADADGDGVAGLVLLEARLQDVRSGEPVHVAIAPTEGLDIDQRSVYEVTLRIGDSTQSAQVSAALVTTAESSRSSE